MMRVIVAGAGGFLGRRISRELRANGAEVWGVGRGGPPPGFEGSSWCQLELGDTERLTAFCRDTAPDAVVNLAGRVRGSLTQIYEDCVMAPVSLLEALEAASSKAALIQMGSAAEYGLVPVEAMPIREETPCSPVGNYGLAKHAASLACLEQGRQGRRVTVLRLFNAIGPGVPDALVLGAVVKRAGEALRAGRRSVAVGNVESQRDFVSADFVAWVVRRVLEVGPWGEVLNVSSGRPRSIRSVLTSMFALNGLALELQTDPTLFRSNDHPLIFGSNSKLESTLGQLPSDDFERCLIETWQAANTGAI